MGLHSREINLSQGEPCHPAAANVDERSGYSESQSSLVGGEVERVRASVPPSFRLDLTTVFSSTFSVHSSTASTRGFGCYPTRKQRCRIILPCPSSIFNATRRAAYVSRRSASPSDFHAVTRSAHRVFTAGGTSTVSPRGRRLRADSSRMPEISRGDVPTVVSRFLPRGTWWRR